MTLSSAFSRFAFLLLAFAAPELAVAQLPLPALRVPEAPPLQPLVVTAEGQKLLLGHTDVVLRWNPASQQVESNRPGWWIINYPFDRIQGLENQSRDEIAQQLFARPYHEIKNWYLRTPPASAAALPPEPEAPVGPAPFNPNRRPTIIVNPAHPSASDLASPFRSLSAAIAKAGPGDVVHVYPGIYRESLLPDQDGKANAPVVVEGLRGPDGTLPVITGNDRAPAGAWKPVPGLPDVWRAESWGPGPASLSLQGRLLRERTLLSELEPGEFINNRGSPELVAPRVFPDQEIEPGNPALGLVWRRQAVDEKGALQLGSDHGLYYLSTWVWINPRKKSAGLVVDPATAGLRTVGVSLPGGFRASRQTSSRYGSQLNPYRFWLNGELMPAFGLAGEPRAISDFRVVGDRWERLPLREGWNHLALLLDSSFAERHPNRIAFQFPRGFDGGVTSATAPVDRTRPTDAPRAPHATEWLVLGPLKPEQKERALYLRMPPGQDPNQSDIDLAVRTDLARLNKPYWTVRGLEFRHGTQYMQQAQVTLSAPGVVFEHNILREAEVRAISIRPFFPQEEEPIVIRGNWIISPGALGMGATADSRSLTADNLASPPKRGRVLIEHNHIIGNNRAGYELLWESGAMKFFRLTGTIVRHNTIVEGNGPGLWYDWENYALRTEGNLFVRSVAFAVGTEASPGPHLIANNVSVGLLPAKAWFENALLGWSSGRVWNVHNTIDNIRESGRRASGIRYSEGPDNRDTAWKAVTDRDAAVVNNLVFNSTAALHRARVQPVVGNLFYGSDKSGLARYSRWSHPEQAMDMEASSQMAGTEPLPAFNNPARGDYRPAAGSRADSGGVDKAVVKSGEADTDVVGLVTHDFFGLLRHPADRRDVGAFRVERPSAPGQSAQLEAELVDGTLLRYWEPLR